MNKGNTLTMDPLIEGYLRYLDKVGRKTPRTQGSKPHSGRDCFS
jgi:hypothetical protein